MISNFKATKFMDPNDGSKRFSAIVGQQKRDLKPFEDPHGGSTLMEAINRGDTRSAR